MEWQAVLKNWSIDNESKCSQSLSSAVTFWKGAMIFIDPTSCECYGSSHLCCNLKNEVVTTYATWSSKYLHLIRGAYSTIYISLNNSKIYFLIYSHDFCNKYLGNGDDYDDDYDYGHERERMGVGINLILEFALSFVLLAVQGLHSAQYIKLNMNIWRWNMILD